MKKSLYFILLIGLSWACQKREYPVFQHLPSSAYIHPKSTSILSNNDQPTQVTTQSSVASPQLAASANDDVASVVQPSKPSYSTAQESVSKVTEAPIQQTWQEKVISKKIQKRVEKVSSSTKAASPKAKADTVALLSLIFGGAGLLLLLAGGGLGLLLGLAGLIMGIIGLSRVKRGLAPQSSRTMAILGIIFGGVVTLLAILVIAVVAANFTFV